VDAKIRSEIDAQLAQKGYRLDTASKPDLFVTYQVTRQDKEEVVGPSYSGGEEYDILPMTYSEGTLVVSMLDPSLKMTLCRGTAEWRRNPRNTLAKSEAGAKTMIDQIFERVPGH
jgi:hypothetical protein